MAHGACNDCGCAHEECECPEDNLLELAERTATYELGPLANQRALGSLSVLRYLDIKGKANGSDNRHKP